jgi:hypothetical protein
MPASWTKAAWLMTTCARAGTVRQQSSRKEMTGFTQKPYR